MSNEDTEAGDISRATHIDVPLNFPILRGETEIKLLTLARPGVQHLRGMNLGLVTQMDVDQTLKLLPRITSPSLTPHECEKLDASDLLHISSVVLSFFLPKLSKELLFPYT